MLCSSLEASLLSSPRSLQRLSLSFLDKRTEIEFVMDQLVADFISRMGLALPVAILVGVRAGQMIHQMNKNAPPIMGPFLDENLTELN